MATLLTPVGRMVAGSLYKPNTTDWQGNPLVTKTGANAGQPRQEYFFQIAIAKGSEQHWSQTPWGAVIFNAATEGFPNGEPQRPDFAWKVTDGDSTVPNKKGVTPVSKTGFAGHWVLGFSSGFAPSVYTADGTQQIAEPDAVKNGYYIQVSGTVVANGNAGNAGVYLNHDMVALAGYGEEIHNRPDAAAVGFGGVALPVGASPTPLAGSFNPAAQPQSIGVPAQQIQQPINVGASLNVPVQQLAAPVQQPIQQQPMQAVQPAVQYQQQQEMLAPVAGQAPAAQYAIPIGTAQGVPAAETPVGNQFINPQ